jgi:hypothetical protein
MFLRSKKRMCIFLSVKTHPTSLTRIRSVVLEETGLIAASF